MFFLLCSLFSRPAGGRLGEEGWGDEGFEAADNLTFQFNPERGDKAADGSNNLRLVGMAGGLLLL